MMDDYNEYTCNNASIQKYESLVNEYKLNLTLNYIIQVSSWQ